MARVLSYLIRYLSNYYTLHRSDLAARAAPLDPRLINNFHFHLQFKSPDSMHFNFKIEETGIEHFNFAVVLINF